MKSFLVLLVLVAFAGCNIIPDGSLSDVPNSSELSSIKYTQQDGTSIYGEVSLSADKYTVDWGANTITIVNTHQITRTEVEINSSLITSIKHFASGTTPAQSFEISYDNGKFSEITVTDLNDEFIMTDLFYYDLFGALDSIARVKTYNSGLPTEYGYVKIDPGGEGPGFDILRTFPYDANFIGHWSTSLFEFWESPDNPNRDNTVAAQLQIGGSSINLGVFDPADEEIDQRYSSLIEIKRDVFSRRTRELILSRSFSDGSGVIEKYENYPNPFHMIPNDTFLGPNNYAILEILYYDLFKGTTLLPSSDTEQVYEYGQTYSSN